MFISDMLKLFILVALAACCLAAPTTIDNDEHSDRLLQRPSPINPDIIGDPKPQEKITKITDPVELAIIKRETDKKTPTSSTTLLIPTVPPVQPNDKAHSEVPSATPVFIHRQKRDQKPVPAVIDKKPTVTEVTKSNVYSQTTPISQTSKSTQHKRQAQQTQPKSQGQQKQQQQEQQNKQTQKNPEQRQHTQGKSRSKRDNTATRVPALNHSVENIKQIPSVGVVQPQTLPAHLPGNAPSVKPHANSKREVKHSDENSKEHDSNEQATSAGLPAHLPASAPSVKPHANNKREVKHSDENSKEYDSHEQTASAGFPAHLPASAPSVKPHANNKREVKHNDENSKDHDSHEQTPSVPSAKPHSITSRDVHTSLAPNNEQNGKDHSLEDSKEEDSKEKTSSNTKPQILPALIPASGVPTRAHLATKRDIPVPLTPKHQHPEGSAKVADKKEQLDVNSHTKDEKSGIKDVVNIKDLNQHPQQNGENIKKSQSTTNHPVIRQHPVPVAELFNRAQN